MLTLLTSWYGAFLVDERGNVREKRLFAREGLADVLKALDEGRVLDDERALAPKEGVLVLEDRLLAVPGAHLARDAERKAARAVERRLASEARDAGLDARALHGTALALGKSKVRKSSSSRDMHVVQAVDAIDELSAEANVIMERLREWYGLHFPELLDVVERQEELAGVIAAHGTRDAIRAARPEYDIPSPMGADVTPADEAGFRGLARSASTLYATRAELEKYLDQEMPGIAPNVTRLVGAVLAARLIRHAGGLRRLAMMPAGTVQTLGAEKALFRHIKEGKKPPKHGVIFQHPALHRAPRHQRGPLARALAGKITLASRADYFTHDATLAETLVKQFDARTEAIKIEHAKPSGRAGRPDVRDRKAERGPPRDQRYDRGSRPPPREGGFGRGPPREERGGFGRGPPREAREGGYPPRGPPREREARGPPPREGNYPPPREGGFPPRGPPREDRGGFKPRGPPAEGGFRPRGPPPEGGGGFKPRGPPKSGGGFASQGPATRRDFERRPPPDKKKFDKGDDKKKKYGFRRGGE